MHSWCPIIPFPCYRLNCIRRTPYPPWEQSRLEERDLTGRWKQGGKARDSSHWTLRWWKPKDFLAEEMLCISSNGLCRWIMGKPNIKCNPSAFSTLQNPLSSLEPSFVNYKFVASQVSDQESMLLCLLSIW